MLALHELTATLSEYRDLDDSECMTLPPDAYVSPALYQLEIDRIFRREWLCVGREEQVPSPGDYFTADVIGEPMVIVHGSDGILRALNTVCRHRFMPVVEGRGHADRFICPYHAWTYDTTGALTAAPYMQGAKNFDQARCRLPNYRLETWYGFIFVNLHDKADPLAPRMRTLEKAIASYRVASQRQVLPYEAEWRGNWKLSAENSMEYYHHIGLHKDTVGVQLPGTETYVCPAPADRSFTHERSWLSPRYRSGNRTGSNHAMNPSGRLDSFTEEDLDTGYMVYIFPAFTMAMRPNGNNWLSFRPLGPESTQVLGGYMVSPDLLAETPDIVAQRRDLIAKVNEEDSLATTKLAKMMRSTKAGRGPLSPFEGTIAQFYRYLARALGEQAGDAVRAAAAD
jgi:phenylpropionate dioxygenase-like ring-hydroxylating dioxygenase large terminal subunit